VTKLHKINLSNTSVNHENIANCD